MTIPQTSTLSENIYKLSAIYPSFMEPAFYTEDYHTCHALFFKLFNFAATLGDLTLDAYCGTYFAEINTKLKDYIGNSPTSATEALVMVILNHYFSISYTD